MITANNEFETVPAFTHIAGCSLGTWSQLDNLQGCIDAVSSTTQTDCKEYKAMIDKYDHGNDISSHDSFIIDEMIEEMIDILNNDMPIPDSCSVSWQDNELLVLPYIDDEIPRYEDIPDNLQNGDYTIYVVNDHGNVTCMYWDDQKREYISQWDMV